MQAQLTLRVGLSDHADFDNFFIGSNTEVVTALRDFLRQQAGLIFLFGDEGSGKTHLLYAAQKRATADSRRAAYLSMSDAEVVGQLTSFVDHGELVCIDDVHRAAGSSGLERVLFNLIEQQRQSNGSVILAADRPTRSIPFATPDLQSRVGSGASYRVRALTDEQKVDAIRLRAQHRGIELTDDVINYVMKRYARDTSSLFSLLGRIDEASLSAQRLVTIPFIRQMEELRDGEGVLD